MNRYISAVMGAGCLLSAATAGPEMTAGMAWDSIYVAEGREAIGGDGILWTGGSGSLGILSLEALYGKADSLEADAYGELSLYAGLDFEVGDVVAGIGYQRFEFDHPDASDDELHAGLVYNRFVLLQPGIHGYYSRELEGGFVELYLQGGLFIVEETLLLSVHILEGVDFGYNVEDYEGINHLQTGVELMWSVLPTLHVRGYLNHSWAHSRVQERDPEMDDVLWGGFGADIHF